MTVDDGRGTDINLMTFVIDSGLGQDHNSSIIRIRVASSNREHEMGAHASVLTIKMPGSS